MNTGQIKNKARTQVRYAAMACLCATLLLSGSFPAFAAGLPPDKDAGASVTTGTRNGKALIESDPETGDRILRTPEKAKQTEPGAPQTVIVTPEITISPRLPRGSR